MAITLATCAPAAAVQATVAASVGSAGSVESSEAWSTVTVSRRGHRAGGDEVRDIERDAFDGFVRARLPELLRFGRALTGSAEAGADLVQDALERTLLAWPRLQSRDEPEGYVRRIMVNRNISIWRKLSRERVTDPIDLVDDQRIEQTPFDDDLWKALHQLPPKQRAVIALRYYEDLSEAEIAPTLGCSVGTVKSQASKALAKLRALVPRDGEE